MEWLSRGIPQLQLLGIIEKGTRNGGEEKTLSRFQIPKQLN